MRHVGGQETGTKLSKAGPRNSKTGTKLSKPGPKYSKTGPKLSKTSHIP